MSSQRLPGRHEAPARPERPSRRQAPRRPSRAPAPRVLGVRSAPQGPPEARTAESPSEQLVLRASTDPFGVAGGERLAVTEQTGVAVERASQAGHVPKVLRNSTNEYPPHGAELRLDPGWRTELLEHLGH